MYRGRTSGDVLTRHASPWKDGEGEGACRTISHSRETAHSCLDAFCAILEDWLTASKYAISSADVVRIGVLIIL